MPFWKKRDEGFEWHKYVRTTIKLRREARRQKAQQIGAQVAEGAKAAGAAADVMARRGAQRAGEAARDLGADLGRLTISGVALAGLGLGALAKWLGRQLDPAVDILGRPGVGGPLTLVGLIAAAAGAGRALLGANGLDAEAIAALGIGVVCTSLGLGPTLWHGHAVLPRQLAAPVTGLPPRPWLMAGGAGLVVLVGAIGLSLLSVRPNIPFISSLPALPLVGGEPIKGRATVLAADMLRIGDSTIRLSGIEVPDPDQRCPRAGPRSSGRTWACGQEARETAQRLVQAQMVACDAGRQDGAGIIQSRCRAGGADIAEALVRAGYGFAAAGLVSPYRGAEDSARTSKAGIWGSAEPERPAVWREKVWSAAKQQAPDGCPIKGRVRGNEREYLLPWASDYERVRISKRRGERWFCSEQEAVSAGWRSARRG